MNERLSASIAPTQGEFPSILSNWIGENDRQARSITEIEERLMSLLPAKEMSGSTIKESQPQQPGMIGSMREQLNYAASNSRRLEMIAKHLSTLI